MSARFEYDTARALRGIADFAYDADRCIREAVWECLFDGASWVEVGEAFCVPVIDVMRRVGIPPEDWDPSQMTDGLVIVAETRAES